MKTKLLSIVFTLVVTFGFAQTETITVPWDFFSVPASDTANFPLGPMFDTEFTIEVGDKVVWEWLSNGHNVKSVAGSTETFGTTGGDFDTFLAPYSYEYTFTQVGVNPYVCKPHEFFMYGTVTVVPEGTLSNRALKENISFSLSPNPSNQFLNLSLPIAIDSTALEVFDVLGKKIYELKIGTANFSRIDVSSWNSGVYLVKVSNDYSSQTKRFVKQ